MLSLSRQLCRNGSMRRALHTSKVLGIDDFIDRHVLLPDGSKYRTPQEETRQKREVLRLYRDVLRSSKRFKWADQAGRPWKEVLAESARKEFEEARYENDPIIVARLIVGGRDALDKIEEKLMHTESLMRKKIEDSRNRQS